MWRFLRKSARSKVLPVSRLCIERLVESTPRLEMEMVINNASEWFCAHQLLSSSDDASVCAEFVKLENEVAPDLLIRALHALTTSQQHFIAIRSRFVQSFAGETSICVHCPHPHPHLHRHLFCDSAKRVPICLGYWRSPSFQLAHESHKCSSHCY